MKKLRFWLIILVSLLSLTITGVTLASTMNNDSPLNSTASVLSESSNTEAPENTLASNSTAIQPDLIVTPLSLDAQLLPDETASLSMTITNDGVGDLSWVLINESGPMSWLNLDPLNGITPPGGSSQVNIGFDPTGMEAGVYTTGLIMITTDPYYPNIRIPVSMNVYQMGITFTKTVGTERDVCADTHSISVNPGTVVSYCFSAYNTGTITTTMISLYDTILGQTMDQHEVGVPPGMNVYHTQTVTITGDITNTATFTFFVDETHFISATDSASVTVTKADLAVNIAGPTEVGAGDLIIYTISVENLGPDEATNVEVMDTLPIGATPVPTESCSYETDLITCNFGSIPNGGTGSIDLVITTQTAGNNLNRVVVTADQADLNLENNEDVWQTTVTQADFQSFLPIVYHPTAQPFNIADVIFYNGTVITIDDGQPVAEAIALRGSLIQAVGTKEQIMAYRGSETTLVDLEGQTLMPGFVDPHTHIFNDAPSYLGIDYLQAQQLALQNGITTVGDMWVNPNFLAAMQAMDYSGQLHVRTSLYLTYSDVCGTLTGDWYQFYPPTRKAGEMLRIGGLKLYADGGVCGSPAKSYELPEVGFGDLWYTQDEMNTMVERLDAAGYQIAIHALGDRAIEQVLNAYEYVLDGEPNTLRHRIEHNATLRPDLIPRYSEVSPVGMVFGSYWACVVEEDPPPPEYRTDWEWPYHDLMLANPDVHIAWHGDYPWVGPVSPLLHLYSMVTPYEIFSNDGTECADPAWMTERSFNVGEVLPMMTIEGAYALFREKEVGSLEVGKYADLIVLSGDPTTIDPLGIKDLKVWMTMVGGDVEWCAPGHEALCP